MLIRQNLDNNVSKDLPTVENGLKVRPKQKNSNTRKIHERSGN